MSTPTFKSDGIEAILTILTGDSRTDAIKADRCLKPPIGCGGEATTFRDEVSRREYTISALCQKCQDDVFGIFGRDPDEGE